MSDTIDDYRAMKEDRQQFRRKQLDMNLRKLFDAGIAYATSNNGIHCQAEADGVQFDIWPSTGRWKVRGSPHSHMGIDRFIMRYNAQRIAGTEAFIERMTRAFPHLKGELK